MTLQINCMKCLNGHQINVTINQPPSTYNAIIAVNNENNHDTQQCIFSVALTAISSIKSLNENTSQSCIPKLKDRILSKLNDEGSREALTEVLKNVNIKNDTNLDEFREVLKEKCRMGLFGRIYYGNPAEITGKLAFNAIVKAPLISLHKMFPNAMTTNTALIGAYLLTSNSLLSRSITNDPKVTEDVKTAELYAYWGSVIVLAKNFGLNWYEQMKKDW